MSTMNQWFVNLSFVCFLFHNKWWWRDDVDTKGADRLKPKYNLKEDNDNSFFFVYMLQQQIIPINCYAIHSQTNNELLPHMHET